MALEGSSRANSPAGPPVPQSRPRLPSSETCSRRLSCWKPRPSRSARPAAGREAAALPRRGPSARGPAAAEPRKPRGCASGRRAGRGRVCLRTTPSRQQRLPHRSRLPAEERRSSHRVARGFSGRIPLKSPHRRRTPPPPAAQAQPGAGSGPCRGSWASGPAHLSFHSAHTDTLSFYSEVLPCGVVYAGRAFSVPVPRGDTREAAGAGSNGNISYGCSRPYLGTRCPALNSGELNKLARVGKLPRAKRNPQDPHRDQV